ncbi:hypothetical protein GOEFS_110_00510 [Gordonia effusa NBRC 100432]|uniref:CinA C-terminal domain-containing protein n=2 Tax=Gordonia effusa TaxID=263908 RepID=H0R5H1_9ACTN|nr:hypothetical protein GOEFS_110_00510 [Gordonia effusa NBRC 100432]
MAGRAARRIAVAESLTGGSLAAALARGPDASEWFCGGVVAYQSHVKYRLLDVPDGPVVSQAAASAMATRTASLFDADLVIAVTGEAGPQPQEDVSPGTVWFGVYDRTVVSTFGHEFGGSPDDVVEKTVAQVLQTFRDTLAAIGPADV